LDNDLDLLGIGADSAAVDRDISAHSGKNGIFPDLIEGGLCVAGERPFGGGANDREKWR